MVCQLQVVPAARVELAPHCWDLNLNQARLPIPPRGHSGFPPEKGLEFLPIRCLACKHNPPRKFRHTLDQADYQRLDLRGSLTQHSFTDLRIYISKQTEP